jgi:hypothetical protein
MPTPASLPLREHSPTHPLPPLPPLLALLSEMAEPAPRACVGCARCGGTRAAEEEDWLPPPGWALK